MVKIKLPSFRPKVSPTLSNCTSSAKLWDNEELVMTALKVYGKNPRPQCFNEISRVCKLSNLRKSRYFHEKMMKNNPYEDKMRKLLADEGEETYPFFKIFFEEYKTKKERQKLMSFEEDKQSVSNDNSANFVDTNSTDAYGNFEEAYDAPDFDRSFNDKPPGDSTSNINSSQSVQSCCSQEQIAPLISTNLQSLENLELKLKILNKGKEAMLDYFQAFTYKIASLKNNNVENKPEQIDQIGADHLDKDLVETKALITDLKAAITRFEIEQVKLKEDLRLTTYYVEDENKKIQDDVYLHRVQLGLRDEQIFDLQTKLEDSLQQKRALSSKQSAMLNNAYHSQANLNQLKQDLDRLFSQAQRFS